MEFDTMLSELINKQRKNIPHDKKLCYSDLKRLCKYINTTIFDENKCSIWDGYITNENNVFKGIYINFYFRGKKVALHRLLYINFVGELTDNEYLKFSCDNKGKCCCIYHLKKFKYNTLDEQRQSIIEAKNNISKDKKNNQKKVKNNKQITDISINNELSLTLSFD